MNNFLSEGMGISHQQHVQVKPIIIITNAAVGYMLQAPFEVYCIAGIPEILYAGPDSKREVEIRPKLRIERLVPGVPIPA